LYTKATAVKDLICRENGLEAAVNKVEAYFDKSPKKD
jgi:hypothetical protein